MNDVQKYLIEEFVEDYHEQRMGRRELLRRAALIMGGAAAGTMAISTVERAMASQVVRPSRPGAWPGDLSGSGQPGRGEGTMPPAERSSDPVVAPDDPAIMVEWVDVPGEAGFVRSYLARPAADGSYPGVVVIHENRGSVEPNLDIGRRFAKEGFVAIVPDLLSRVGGTEQFADDPMRATGAIGQIGPDAPAADGNAAAAYLTGLPYVNGNLGATGYCFGGGGVWRMGVRNANLKAIVPYYGAPPPADEVSNLRAAALGIYAEADTRLTTAAEDLSPRLVEMGATWELWVAPGANHAFFNNTGGSYAPAAAQQAWRRTLAWFDRFLV